MHQLKCCDIRPQRATCKTVSWTSAASLPTTCSASSITSTLHYVLKSIIKSFIHKKSHNIFSPLLTCRSAIMGTHVWVTFKALIVFQENKTALRKVRCEEADRREEMSRIRSRPSTSTDWLSLTCKYNMANNKAKWRAGKMWLAIWLPFFFTWNSTF